MLLETLMSDPDSVQKALPHPPEGFLVFFGARRRRVGGLGCVKTALFSDFRYPQNRGGGIMLLETLMSDPDSGQKALPHPPEGFLVFFGARRRRVGGLGRASP